MLYLLASDPLAAWGQAAGILLAVYMFVLLLIVLALSLLFMYAFAWIREKSELVKKVRPTVDSVNIALESKSDETLPAIVDHSNRLAQAVYTLQSVQLVQKAKDAQRQASNIEQKVEQGTGRVAGAAIEFRARTVMVQGMLKAFFLPGLTKQKPRQALLPAAERDTANGSLPAGSPGSSAESSDTLVARPNLPAEQAEPVGARQPKPLASKKADRVTHAPVN
jgi:hypothetical protein